MKFLKKLIPFASMVVSGTPVAPLLHAVNALLPNENRLPATATGSELMTAYERLPAGSQAQLDTMAHELEMEKQQTEKWRIMNEADTTGSTLRPQVVLLYARVTAFTVAVFMVFLFYVCWGLKGDDLTKALSGLSNMWALISGVLAVLSAPILKYFGDRSKDKRAKLEAISGSPLGALPDLFSTIKNMVGK